MTQNIYDQEEFFEGYKKLPRSVEGLAGAPEWPSLRALLPAMHGLRLVDLGCGFGWFCRWAREAGAARVLGVDVSERMLAQAAATTTDPAITYAREDMERLALPAASFDLAYSFTAVEDADIREANAGGPDPNGPFSVHADAHSHYISAAVKVRF